MGFVVAEKVAKKAGRGGLWLNVLLINSFSVGHGHGHGPRSTVDAKETNDAKTKAK